MEKVDLLSLSNTPDGKENIQANKVLIDEEKKITLEFLSIRLMYLLICKISSKKSTVLLCRIVLK